jgi:beta-alanine degradation protein BauB
MYRLLLCLALAVSLTAASMSRANAQESSPTGPSQIKVEVENDSFVVLRIRMRPHEKTPMHDVSPRLVIWLTDVHLRDTHPDGQSTELRRSAGSTEWVPAQRHAGENLSDQAIEFLAVVPKSQPPSMPGHGGMPPRH